MPSGAPRSGPEEDQVCARDQQPGETRWRSPAVRRSGRRAEGRHQESDRSGDQEQGPIDHASVDRQARIRLTAFRRRSDAGLPHRPPEHLRLATFSTTVSMPAGNRAAPRGAGPPARRSPCAAIADRTSGASATRSTSFCASSLSRTFSQTRFAVSVFSSRSVASAAVSLSSARSTPRSTARSMPSRFAMPWAPCHPARATGAIARPVAWSSESTVPFWLCPATVSRGVRSGSERPIGERSSSTAPLIRD